MAKGCSKPKMGKGSAVSAKPVSMGGGKSSKGAMKTVGGKPAYGAPIKPSKGH